MGLFTKVVKDKVVNVVQEEVAAGVTKAQLLVVLAQGKANVNALIDLSNEVASAQAADLITDVAEAMQKLYADFEKDPRDLKVAEDFIVDHAPRAVRVITMYAKNLQSGVGSPDDRSTAEESIKQMKASFETMLTKCKENDDEGLALQSETLRRILEMETPTLKS